MKLSDKSQKLEEKLIELDLWTKQGRRLAVLETLESLRKTRLDPQYLPRLAHLANRNHAYLLALRILHPLIRAGLEGISPARPEALAVYARSLLWIGAAEEADRILADVRGNADVVFTQALISFSRWDYAKAIPMLTRYIRSPKITDYQRLVGRVNLIAALITVEKFDDARKLLLILKPEVKAQTQSKILYGNCLEL
jgi:hypothetical protein